MNKKANALWLGYTTAIEVSVLPGPAKAYKDIHFWKNRIFCNILIYFLPLAGIALLLLHVILNTSDRLLAGIYDLFIFLVILFITIAPGLQIQSRKLVMIICLYFFSITILYNSGSFPLTMMYLLGLSFLSIIIFSSSALYFTTTINVVLCLGIGLLTYLQPGSIKMPIHDTARELLLDVINLMVINFVSASCLSLLIQGFENTLLNAKVLEEKLSRNEARLKKAQEICRLGYWQHNLQNKTIWASEEALRIYGLPPEEGFVAIEKVNACIEDINLLRQASRKLIEENKKYDLVFTINPADGSARKIIWALGELERDMMGKPIMIKGILQDITAQKEAEERIKSERNLLRALIDNIPDAIYIKDKHGRKIISNKGDVKISRAISEWEVLGKTSKDLFPGTIGELSYESDLDLIRRGKSLINSELEFIDEKGNPIWLLTTKIPLRNEADDIIGILGINRNITDRKHVEIELKKSNERFEYVNQATFDAIWDWDLLADHVYWGKGFETIFGYNKEGLPPVSSTWSDHIHPDDKERVLASIQSLMDGEAVNRVDEYRYMRSDKTYAYVIDKGLVVRDSSGKAIRMISAMQDISKKKIEEQKLQLLESVITNTNDAVIITEAEPIDAPGGPKIVYVNEALTKLTGYSKEELIGATPRILQGHETSRAELNRLRKAMEKWESCEIEVKNYKKNGDAFWNNISIVPVADEKGWFTHWISIERDVTERKMAEEALQEKNAELKKLSAYLQNIREEERKYIAREVHDELGQLASALKIDIDWLSLKIPSTEENIRNRMAHANKTIEVLIPSIRRIAARLRPSILDDFGLNAALQWHCAEFQNLNGIQCTFEPGFDDAAIITTTKTELFRMVQESLTNVMRHAKATIVLVTTAEDNNNLYLTVKDNGRGFDTRQRKTTLGLLGLRERALSLNGDLQIESEPGNGTTIRAIVPKT